jgi:hypothetical protein
MTGHEDIAAGISSIPTISMKWIELHRQQEIVQRWVESPQTPVEYVPELQEMIKQIVAQIAG